MYNTINQSFSEVYDIILHSEESIYNRIPINFMKMLEEARDRDYKVSIDYSKSINEQNLLHETRVIMSIIYRDFLCSKEEKQRLIMQEKQQYITEQKELKEKYNVDNIFTNNTISNNQKNDTRIVSEKQNKTDVAIIKQENFLELIIRFFKKLFKKK
ncbi:MAG: hypothetical protein IKG56_03310 [Clostridia bacterium]|nr:hypothetical protein [Clostridia bacterium]